jgi:hypothetical protein
MAVISGIVFPRRHPYYPVLYFSSILSCGKVRFQVILAKFWAHGNSAPFLT